MTTGSKLTDVELGQVRDGYPALAAWIARDPDGEAFVFRKFDRLAARNILHLQSRLIALENDIDQLDEEARRTGDSETKQSLRRWETLMKHAENPNRPEKKRVAKLDELKDVLKEYYETLLRQAQVADFRKPSYRVLKTFRDYLDGKAFEKSGSSVPAHSENEDSIPMRLISGRAKEFLYDKADLIALRKANEEDLLSKLLQDHWVFKDRATSDPLDRTAIYKNHYIVRTVAAVSMTLAAILLIVAIISLYSVANPKAKLGLIALYTLLFALSVALLTNARRAEVFGATAAYAAVLVVFVSGDLGSSRGEQCLVPLDNGMFKVVRCLGQ
ncbi:hypothetical protein DM02DRAFT_603402 [Periconia macrospinosa]|uniref:DUF6594 domain-containing protein n=1 Tax=Periconia macrospinosa TaxID=97972 RepID=A0A2V1D8H8_9PLEO|nr:hypothetical protein DM02DRAFT_603402 [Periconia macrospinosa]